MHEHIWAPWRAGFVLASQPKGCVFCRIAKTTDDRAQWIIFRGKLNYVVINKFPYTIGHLLVVPYAHTKTLERLPDTVANEHFLLVRHATGALRATLKPHGVNIGMNLGRLAGAGVQGHLHTHLVPRWAGDNNFMPVIGQTRVHSIDVGPVYERLVATLRKRL